MAYKNTINSLLSRYNSMVLDDVNKKRKNIDTTPIYSRNM